MEPEAPPRAPDALRVASLNIWGLFGDWPRRREVLLQELPKADCDLLLLQEVVRTAELDQLAELKEGLSYAYDARTVADVRSDELEDEGVALLSRLPLQEVAVWPLPPSRPPRHRIEATVLWGGESLRVSTLHAALTPDDGRDAQIRSVGSIEGGPLLIGGDLNARPDEVRELVRDCGLEDALGWSEQPTWPVDPEGWARAWEEKLNYPPRGAGVPERIDYLLLRGLEVLAAGAAALGTRERPGSDHRLVFADLAIS